MFKIGDFSKLTLVSIRMLRYYDEIGLFRPINVDDFTKYRYYSASQIPLLNTIVTLKDLGMSSEEIKQVLHEGDQAKNIKFLKQKEHELIEKLKLDQHRIDMLSHYINHYNEESNNMKYDVVIKDIPSMKCVALKKTIPAYDQEGLLWGELMELMIKHDVSFVPNTLARFHSEPSEEGVTVEVIVEVSKLQENVDGLEFFELEAIKGAATLLVAGDYSPNIQLGFNFFAKWLEENQCSMAGIPRTKYIKGPSPDTDPKDYLTEIILPIIKQAT